MAEEKMSNPNCVTSTNGAMLAPEMKPQKLNTGSATGNPRNKCVLKPGHSLMDWVRLSNSGAELSGTMGRIIPVHPKELAKHNSVKDAWIAIRGHVFNITPYIDFHPGGVCELMRGAGRDATKLFDEVHAWVNYPQLLSKCYIGPLRNDVKVDMDLSESLKVVRRPTNPIEPLRKPSCVVNKVPYPRYDWIQRQKDITLIIYTGQYANPGLLLQRKSETNLQLYIQMADGTRLCKRTLSQSVNWPPNYVRINNEIGKIEVNLQKSDMQLWSDIGEHTTTLLPIGAYEDLEFDFEISNRTDFNHNSFELSLQRQQTNIFIWAPIGYHMGLSCIVDGNVVRRSYTPVPLKYIPTVYDLETNTRVKSSLDFLVKSYPNGGLANHMRHLPIGSVLQVSTPRGSFKLRDLLSHRRFGLLAAGSGLTPFLDLIEYLLKRQVNSAEHIQLIYFNKTEADIWCLKELTQLQTDNEKFHVHHVLSESDADWQGTNDRLSKDILNPLVDKNAMEYSSFVAVCGPDAFNQKAEELLEELGFSNETIHIFQG